jgi:LDH2 family malate/lactate/ureidoglycolate dehydrogenase
LAALLPGAEVLNDAKNWIANPSAKGRLGQDIIVINPAAILPSYRRLQTSYKRDDSQDT